MCGISGMYNIDGIDYVSKETIKEMCNAMIHRGPDEDGFYFDQNIGLGMRRLKIIDLSTGSQPIFNEDKSIVVIFNGEIYNYLELRGYLKKKGHRFYTKSDTEVIVHLYEQYGQNFVTLLNGMFAIALWDNDEKSLFLYRDRLGQKPLHFLASDNGIIFASEIKSLLCDKRYKREIDYASLYHYFSFGYVPAPSTIFKNIRKLLPGHYLHYKEGEVKIEKYWEISYQPDYSKSKNHWINEIRELLCESVKLRLISDVPLGAFLSGGIDSSILVGIMSEIMNQPVNTFSVGFKEESHNELPYAKMVADKFETEHHELIMQASSVTLVDSLIKFFDEPFADYSSIPTFIISRMIRNYVTVAIAGDGGDELFMGYDTAYFRLLRRYHLKLMPMGIRQLLAKIGDFLPQSAYGKRLLQSLDMDNLDFWVRYKKQKNQFFSNDFLKSIGNTDSSQIISNYNTDDTIDELSRFNNINIKLLLPDDFLVKVDRMSMANSLEVRSPFLDHNFVELSAKIPWQFKINNYVTKYILKEAYKDILPIPILNRKKQGFAPPVSVWLRNELKDMIFETISYVDIHFKDIFNANYFKTELNDHLRGRRDNNYLLWMLFTFVKWHNHYAKT